MRLLRRTLFRLTNATPERKAAREHLKLAKTGNAEQYLVLTAKYIDLAQIFFGGCMHEAEEVRLARTEQLFVALWQQLRYAERLSDFEYMLANALIESAPSHGSIRSSEALVTKLRLITPKTRFAFIAYEFERWPLRWVALVMRIRQDALHRLLSEARCELCGISWESLSDEERSCLEAISESLDKSPDLRANKALSKRIALHPRIGEIRAQWLELRPELVEVRHRYLSDQNKREEILKNIFAGTQSATMSRPALIDRVVNTVHFKRHEKIKVS